MEVNHTVPINLICVKYFCSHCAILLVFINIKIIHSFTQNLRLSTLFCAHTAISFSTGNSLTI